MNPTPVSTAARRRKAAYSMAEVVIAVMIIGTLLVALYAGISAGFTVVKVARENLRATQVMVQRSEAIRLYDWSQIRDTNNYLKPSFSEYYSPASLGGSNSGAVYVGFVQTNGLSAMPAAYRNNMRAINITVYWTNRIGKTNITLHREMQTYVARYGIQNYVFGPKN